MARHVIVMRVKHPEDPRRTSAVHLGIVATSGSHIDVTKSYTSICAEFTGHPGLFGWDLAAHFKGADIDNLCSYCVLALQNRYGF